MQLFIEMATGISVRKGNLKGFCLLSTVLLYISSSLFHSCKLVLTVTSRIQPGLTVLYLYKALPFPKQKSGSCRKVDEHIYPIDGEGKTPRGM